MENLDIVLKLIEEVLPEKDRMQAKANVLNLIMDSKVADYKIKLLRERSEHYQQFVNYGLAIRNTSDKAINQHIPVPNLVEVAEHNKALKEAENAVLKRMQEQKQAADQAKNLENNPDPAMQEQSNNQVQESV